MLHRDLDYKPAQQHAIATMIEHILVAGHCTQDGIHIYTPQGDHVGTLNLGLQEDKDIYGIQCSDDGLLHVLVGNDITIRDLYAYKVSSNITNFISPFILIA